MYMIQFMNLNHIHQNTLPLSIVEIISHITMIQNIGMEVLQIKQITTQLIVLVDSAGQNLIEQNLHTELN